MKSSAFSGKHVLHFRVRVNTFLLLALLLAACTDHQAQSIALQPGHRVAAGQFGFNTGTSFYHCNPNTLAPCAQELNDLKPAFLRFPGGVDANYYHMDGPGYGFRKPIGGGASKEGINPSNDDDETKDYDQKQGDYTDPRDQNYPNGENVIGTFIRLVAPGRTPVMFTCNLWDASYAENKRVIDSLLRGGVNIVAFECGNEFYLGQYKAKYPTPQAYLDSARYYTTQLRRDFPGIPVGAIAAPAEVRGITKRLEYYKQWNAALAAQNFYDAIIVHHYGKDVSCTCNAQNYIPDDQLTTAFECANRVYQDEAQHWFGTGLLHYKKQFPNTKLWLTEWNTTNLQKCFGNTQVNNLYFARYQNELATRQSDFVAYSAHHNWIGAGVHFPMASWNKKEQHFDKRSSFLIFNQLQTLYQKETYTLPWPEALLALSASVWGYAYYQPAQAGEPAAVLLSIVNAGGQAHTLPLPDKVSFKISGDTRQMQSASLASVHAGRLEASKGAPGFGKSKVADIVSEQHTVSQSAVIPAYSSNLLKLSL